MSHSELCGVAFTHIYDQVMKDNSTCLEIETNIRDMKNRVHESKETYFLSTIEEVPKYVEICNDLELQEILELEEDRTSSYSHSRQEVVSKYTSFGMRTGS